MFSFLFFMFPEFFFSGLNPKTGTLDNWSFYSFFMQMYEY